jgi:nitrogen fixation-related uncharacterized protein
MILLYLSIPFMLVGLSIALVPLLWAMRQDQQARDAAVAVTVHRPSDRTARMESLAA